jgi:MYXO-CTERM domain-containing protein
MPADLATPNPGDLAGLSVAGGGCALAGDASSRVPAILVFALVLLALSLRRRSA